MRLTLFGSDTYLLPIRLDGMLSQDLDKIKSGAMQELGQDGFGRTIIYYDSSRVGKMGPDKKGWVRLSDLFFNDVLTR